MVGVARPPLAMWLPPPPTQNSVVDTANLQTIADRCASAGGGIINTHSSRGQYHAQVILGHRTILAGDGTILRPAAATGSIVTARQWETTGTIANGSTDLTVADATNARVGAIVGIRGAVASVANVTTIAADVLLADTTITMTSVSKLSTLTGSDTLRTYLLLGAEIVSYLGISGTVLQNVQRGLFGTTAANHSSGTPIAVAERLSARILSIAGNVLTLDAVAPRSLVGTVVTLGAIGCGVQDLTLDANWDNRVGVHYCVDFRVASAPRVQDSGLYGGSSASVIFRHGTRGGKILNNDSAHTGEINSGAHFTLFRQCVHNDIVGNTCYGRGYSGVLIDDRTSTAGEWDGDSPFNNVERNLFELPRVTGGVGILLATGVRTDVSRNRVRGPDIGASMDDSNQSQIIQPATLNDLWLNTYENCNIGCRFRAVGGNRAWKQRFINCNTDYLDEGDNDVEP